MRKLDEGIFLYPGSPSTLIILENDGVILIDPGRGKERHKDLMRESRRMGVGIKAQLLTHAHSDHIEACRKINAPVYAHRFEFSIAESPILRELATFGSRVSGDEFKQYLTGELKVHAVFEWGDEPLGVKTIRLSGHSPGMTGFLKGNVLYAGDSIFGDRLIKAVGIPYFTDYDEFLKSLEKVRDFAEKGYTIVPSHGPVVKGEKAIELTDFNIKRAREVESLVLESIATPKSVDEITLEVMEHYGVAATLSSITLNMIPVRAILNSLCRRGLAKAIVKKGLMFRRKS